MTLDPVPIRRFRGLLALTVSTVLLAVLTARLGYVWTQRDSYLDAPLTILDFRDGGWTPAIGLLTGWIYALVLIKLPSGLRKPLMGLIGLLGIASLMGFAAIAFLPSKEARFIAADPIEVKDAAALLARFNGKPLVVNLWATWCPPCQREMPLLQRLQLKRPDIHVVFLNQGEPVTSVRQFLSSHALPLQNVLLDPKSETGRALDNRDPARTLFFDANGSSVDLDALPKTLFFDPRGRLVDVYLGELSPATLAQRLQRLGPPLTAAPPQ